MSISKILLTFCPYICYYICTDKGKEVLQVSPKGRPTQAKKDKRFEIRLTSETYSTLEECAERLNLSKAQVIHKGIELVKENLDKK